MIRRCLAPDARRLSPPAPPRPANQEPAAATTSTRRRPASRRAPPRSFSRRSFSRSAGNFSAGNFSTPGGPPPIDETGQRRRPSNIPATLRELPRPGRLKQAADHTPPPRARLRAALPAGNFSAGNFSTPGGSPPDRRNRTATPTVPATLRELPRPDGRKQAATAPRPPRPPQSDSVSLAARRTASTASAA